MRRRRGWRAGAAAQYCCAERRKLRAVLLRRAQSGERAEPMALPVEMSVLLSDVRDDRSFLDFSLAQKPTPTIEGPRDIIIRMEACPVNPSDIGVIFGASSRLEAVQNGEMCVSAPIDPKFKGAFESDQYGNSREGGIVCGNEGAGVVVAAGEGDEAQALLGKVVATFGSGGCYATYYKARAGGNAVMAMPDGVTPREAASSFVNPLTVLGMLSTALEEGHSALVHTAAASQLGQMMVRVCMADEIPLVNVVRRPEQEELLRSINPDAIIVSQASPSFEAVRSKLQFEHQQQRLHSLLVADLFINDTNKDF